MKNAHWFKLKDQQVELIIFVKPKAKRTALVDINEQGMIISLHAKPHEGQANRELINFLAELLNLPKTQITLLHGEHSRYKHVLVPLNTTVQKLLIDPAKFIAE